MFNKKFMQRAITESIKNIDLGGGPFGAVITKDEKIVAIGSNRVTCNNDPTAHAEIMAIRKASQKLGTFNLKGCEIYTSCEPCPMCLGAIYWAHIDRIYYGCSKNDAAKINFDDSFIYNEIIKENQDRKIPITQELFQEAIKAFQYWENKKEKTKY